MKKDSKITLKDALTYDGSNSNNTDSVSTDNNSSNNAQELEQPPTPLQLINAYLGIILNKIVSNERLIIAAVILCAVNFFISLGIIIFK